MNHAMTVGTGDTTGPRNDRGFRCLFLLKSLLPIRVSRLDWVVISLSGFNLSLRRRLVADRRTDTVVDECDLSLSWLEATTLQASIAITGMTETILYEPDRSTLSHIH